MPFPIHPVRLWALHYVFQTLKIFNTHSIETSHFGSNSMIKAPTPRNLRVLRNRWYGGWNSNSVCWQSVGISRTWLNFFAAPERSDGSKVSTASLDSCISYVLVNLCQGGLTLCAKTDLMLSTHSRLSSFDGTEKVRRDPALKIKIILVRDNDALFSLVSLEKHKEEGHTSVSHSSTRATSSKMTWCASSQLPSPLFLKKRNMPRTVISHQ